MIREEKGQSLLELALVLPVLLLLVTAIFDFGRIFYMYTHLHLATQETVRLGGLGQDDAEMTTFVRDYFHGDADELVIYITPQEGDRRSGEYVTVSLTYSMDYMTPVLKQILPSPVELQTDSSIRVE